MIDVNNILTVVNKIIKIVVLINMHTSLKI